MEFNYNEVNPDRLKREDIIHYANKLYAKAYDYWKDVYDESKEDVLFYAGYQEEYYEYNEDKTGKLLEVFNILPQFINRVVGGQRMMTYSITVHPTGDTLGKEEPVIITKDGVKLKLSEFLQDLIRGIEYQSNAINQYKLAFKQALESGFGWLRVYYEYEGDSFNYIPRIKAIPDRWSVVIDPNVKEPDFSDMNYCFITQKVEKEKFRELYPDVDLTSFNNAYWVDGDYIVVAEFFERITKKEKIYLLETGDVVKEKDLPKYEGIKVIKSRVVNRNKVYWSKITGNKVLEKRREFPTSTIPVIPVLGRVIYTDKRILLRGLINQTINTQKAINRIMSSMLEVIDIQPITPFIVSDKAIVGYEKEYATANKFRHAYLPYHEGHEPPRREAPPITPSAQINAMQVLEHLVQAQTGIYAVNLGAPSNERTGVAIRTRQQEGDIGTYEFIDNYAMAIRRVGQVLVELIPKIYDTHRVVMAMSIDGAKRYVEINNVIYNPKIPNGYMMINNLDWGSWYIDIEAGKNYSTKREESTEQIAKLMQYSPQIAQIGADILVKNLDFADSNILANRLKQTIPLNMLTKEEIIERVRREQELQQIIPQQPQQQNPEVIKEQLKNMQEQLKVEIEKLKLQQQQMRLQMESYRGQYRLATDENKRKNEVAKSIIDKIKNEGI